MNKFALALLIVCSGASAADMYTCIDKTGFKRLKNFKCDSDERTLDQQTYEDRAATTYRPTPKTLQTKPQPANIADGLDLTSPAGVAAFALRAQPIIEGGAAKKRAATPPTTTAAPPNTCQATGNMYYCDNGASYQRVGNTIYGSDGTSTQRVGNLNLNSDGTSSQQIGNTLFNSDGSSCQRIGSITFCN